MSGPFATAPQPGRATAPASAGHRAPTPQPSPTPATSTNAMTTAPAAPRGGKKKAAARAPRQAGSTASGLARLTAATVLACGLNGAAAYAYVQSDAVSVASSVQQQVTTLDAVSRTVGSMDATAKSLRDNPSLQDAYLQDVEGVSTRLAEATARAANGPAGSEQDVAPLTNANAAYTRYVSTLERARTAPANRSTALFDEARTIRTQRLEPALAQVTERNRTRSDDVEITSTVTTGVLGATTIASLAALLGGAWWLARRTKRVVNPGLVGATLLSAAVSAYAFSSTLANPPVPNGPWTAPVVLLGGLAAAGLAWAGLEQRRKEYR